MPASFVIFLVVFFCAVGMTTVWLWTRQAENNDEGVSEGFLLTVKIGTVVFTVLAVVMLAVSSLASVAANEVGIVTNFGRWVGTVDSGLHVVAPWSNVDTFPTRNQKSIRDAGNSGEADCVSVKLKGNASACVDLTVLYTIDSSRAEVLWRGWGSFAKLNTDLIERATDDAVNEVLSAYPAEELAANRSVITEAVNTALDKRLTPQGVRLESVTLGDPHLPREVQDRINSILEADARVKVAQRAEEQAAAEARAARARQVSLTPEALIKECLDAAREIKPAVLNCGLGAPAQTPVIVAPRS
jgi:regulator of protease activity HflC (stomatin/prohibitin superfamily)